MNKLDQGSVQNFTQANDYQVGDLIFTGSDTIKTRSIGMLDKVIITFQRIHSLIFHGKFYSKAARNTHVAIVVEVDKANNAVWIAEAVPTVRHKNDLRQVNMMQHKYYKLDPGSIETYEVLRPKNPQVKTYAEKAAQKAQEASKRIEIGKNAPASKEADEDSQKTKHKFSHIKGLWALLVKERNGDDLTPEEFDLSRRRSVFCSYFVSLMLRNGEYATRAREGEANGLDEIPAKQATFNFDPKTNSPQKLREHLENNNLFEQVGVVTAPPKEAR